MFGTDGALRSLSHYKEVRAGLSELSKSKNQKSLRIEFKLFGLGILFVLTTGLYLYVSASYFMVFNVLFLFSDSYSLSLYFIRVLAIKAWILNRMHANEMVL
jgi:hypothetical protein